MLMRNFNQVAQLVLNGTYSGVFRLRNNEHVPSHELMQKKCPVTGYDYPYILKYSGKTYTSTGWYYYGKETPFDIVEFIKN